MMKRPLLALFSLFLTLPALAAPVIAPQDDASEPPAQYELQINGKAVPMTLGKEISLDRKAGRTRYLLVRGATRRFDKSGLKFDYPADYNFEADLRDPEIAVWTLGGRSALLTIQRFPLAGPALLRERMARELTALYGSKNVKIKPAALLLGGRGVEGKKLLISLAKQSLSQEIFAFSGYKYAWVLIVQDLPTQGRETDEARELKALLARSGSF